MAQFRGWIKGQRGQASRLGSKNSGLAANLASWQGSVAVSLWTTDDGVDMARVALVPHTNGAGEARLLYDGPVSGKGGDDDSRKVEPEYAHHSRDV